MQTPIERQLQEKRAALSAQQRNDAEQPREDLSEYDKSLMRIAHAQHELKTIKSRDIRAGRKAEYLVDFEGYIEGALSPENTRQDDVLVRLMIWSVDVSQYTQALKIAEHAIRNGWQMPTEFTRDITDFIVEEIAEQAIKIDHCVEMCEVLVVVENLLKKLGEEIGTGGKLDITDEVCAKLLRALGEAREGGEDEQSALAYYEQAYVLNPKCGVKGLINKLTKKFAEESLSQEPASQKPETQKPDLEEPEPEELQVEQPESEKTKIDAAKPKGNGAKK